MWLREPSHLYQRDPLRHSEFILSVDPRWHAASTYRFRDSRRAPDYGCVVSVDSRGRPARMRGTLVVIALADGDRRDGAARDDGQTRRGYGRNSRRGYGACSNGSGGSSRSERPISA